MSATITPAQARGHWFQVYRFGSYGGVPPADQDGLTRGEADAMVDALDRTMPGYHLGETTASHQFVCTREYLRQLAESSASPKEAQRKLLAAAGMAEGLHGPARLTLRLADPDQHDGRYTQRGVWYVRRAGRIVAAISDPPSERAIEYV